MGIKNWTVRTERISGKAGGLAAYRRYLSNSEHKNHKGSTIIELQDGDKFLEFCVVNTAIKDLKITKGRKVESYAQSFVFSLPYEIQPTVQQWQAINSYLKAKLKEKLEITSDDAFFTNLHIEKDKNSHLNMMISRSHKNGQLISNLDKFEILGLSKKEFTNAVKTFCNADPKDYVVKEKDGEEKNKKKKKVLKMWQYKPRAKKKNKLTEVKNKIEQVNPNKFFGFNQNSIIKLKPSM